jgi:endonuclease/exonuclease/phosphatase family metal-dependent hydrolase
LVVRTWNLFHGNAVPPSRRAYVEAMVRLVCADGPGIVCLQEVPVGVLGLLGAWSGMTPFTAVAEGPRLGGVRFGSVLTGLHAGVFSRWFSGNGHAILVEPGLQVVDECAAEIGEPGERRVCQAVRIAELGVVANVHATWRGAADEQLRRAVLFVESVAKEGEAVVLCGDVNLRPESGTTYDLLAERGYSPPAAGVDQILVRGIATGELRAWPTERRRSGGRLLSDHAPLELTLDLRDALAS